MTLINDRIVLRPYLIADAVAICRWKNDPETTRWMGRRFRKNVTLEEARRSLQAAIDTLEDQVRFFAIAERETLRYLGGIDLTDIDHTDRNAVLSMVIGAPEHRGKGYGSEAVQLILAYAFNTLNLHKISLTVYEKNGAALRCYLKNGFRPEGRIRDHMRVQGEYSDLIPMGILEGEYRRLQVTKDR